MATTGPTLASDWSKVARASWLSPGLLSEAAESVSQLSKQSLFTEPRGEPLFLVVSESYPLSSDLDLENFLALAVVLFVTEIEIKCWPPLNGLVLFFGSDRSSRNANVFVRSVQTCLELSIFIIQAQIFELISSNLPRTSNL